MQIYIPENLQKLAEDAPQPLYLVGGMVRNCLLNLPQGDDFDIASPLSAENFCTLAQKYQFQIHNIYSRTGTVQLTDGKHHYEFTTFRKDSYKNGNHHPVSISFTNDIETDALRRDFKCNAIYFDIKKQEIVDPLNGQTDIQDKIITTTRSPEEVFAEDGLRLMRLARFAATLHLEIDLPTLFAAKFHASYIQKIVPERVFHEFQLILQADKKYNIPYAHYTGLKVLEGIDIFNYILPELALGKNMPQRADFHNHNVFEHALRTCKYAHHTIRLAALLHDIGKPTCYINTGKYHGHDICGVQLLENILTRLKVSKRQMQEVITLTKLHMFDLDGKAKEATVRKFFVQHVDIIDKLLLLKQADFSAGKDELQDCPTVLKWKQILQKMEEEKVPFSLKDLKISGSHLKDIVTNAKDIGKILGKLLYFCAIDSSRNQQTILLQEAKNIAKQLEQESTTYPI